MWWTLMPFDQYVCNYLIIKYLKNVEKNVNNFFPHLFFIQKQPLFLQPFGF